MFLKLFVCISNETVKSFFLVFTLKNATKNRIKLNDPYSQSVKLKVQPVFMSVFFTKCNANLVHNII